MLAATLLFAASLASQAAPSGRMARVDRWLHLLQEHSVGGFDAAAEEVASWSDADLGRLFEDLRNLVLTMRSPGGTAFYANWRGGHVAVYSGDEQRWLTAFACAAGGVIDQDVTCKRINSALFDDGLWRLNRLAAEGEGVGADNYILKYGALPHTDIAMFAPAPATTATGGAQALRVQSTDGEPTRVSRARAHWEIARMLLDNVRSTRITNPAPKRDAFVRTWYVATNTWMQFNVHYDTSHLEGARRLFPDDRDILFLFAAQHEIYATPRMQNVIKTVALPRGFTLDPYVHGDELREARDMYRRALKIAPGFAEARLRLGRVLALQHNFSEAERELRLARESLDDEENRYFAALFLGAVEEALGRFDAAEQSFTEAEAQFPLAQSPMLCLAELASRRGDRRAALDRLRVLFVLPAASDSRRDPWWVYDIWHARAVDDRLDDLWRPFRRERIR